MAPKRQRQFLMTLRERVDPRHAAVLVVDMQNDYVSLGGTNDRRRGVGAAQAIIPNVRSLLDAARDAGALVVYVCMTLDPDLEVVSDIVYLSRKARYGDMQNAVKGTWGHQVTQELSPQPGDLMVEKTRGSGFQGTNLDMLLRARGIRSTIVCGVVTTGCVEATARDALNNDYWLTIASDCVANADRWEQHYACLKRFEESLYYPDSVVPAQRIIDEWSTFAPTSAPPQAVTV